MSLDNFVHILTRYVSPHTVGKCEETTLIENIKYGVCMGVFVC